MLPAPLWCRCQVAPEHVGRISIFVHLFLGSHNTRFSFSGVKLFAGPSKRFIQRFSRCTVKTGTLNR